MTFDPVWRYEDTQEAFRAAMDGRQAETWTALPGIIQSFDAIKITVSVQPSIQLIYNGPDGSRNLVNIPVLPDVPVVFPRGGGYELTFPIKPGDECLVVFSSRCIDFWWDQGGVQPQREFRMHDLSDGFCIPGPWSQKTKISNLSTTTVQLRSDDGANFFEINSAAKTATAIVGGTSMIINDNDNSITMKAELRVTGNVIAGWQGSDQVTLQKHVHTQGNDSHGDAEVPTNPATPGT